MENTLTGRYTSDINNLKDNWRPAEAKMSKIKTTRYFEEQVLRKRPYIKIEWCSKAVLQSHHKEKQPDGRVRYWIFIPELDKYLRVVTLEDGETIHNAFPDRNFKGVKSK